MAFEPASFPLRQIRFSPGEKPSCTCPEGAACKSLGKHPACYWSDLAKGEVWNKEGEPYGIATGTRSGVFVVDTDIKPGINGDMALTSLGGMPTTRTVRTGSGGNHYYLNLPEGFNVHNSSGLVGPGIDIRGEGGFVVGPGSPHKSGGSYELVLDAPVADAPEWLLAILRTQAASRSKKGTGDLSSVIARGPEHEDFDARCKLAVTYLEDPRQLPSDAEQGGTTFFKVCLKLVRTLELPLDVCVALISEVYNPRLVAMGATPWAGRFLESKLTDARDKSDRPTGTEAAAFAGAFKSPPTLATETVVNPDTGEVSTRVAKSTLVGSYVGKLSKCTDTELVTHLLTSDAWRGVWRFNEFTEKVCASGAPTERALLAQTEDGLEATDITRVKLWFEKEMGLLVSQDQVQRALPLVAMERSFHPIRDYLKGLPRHTGRSHFDGIMNRLFGTQLPIHDIMFRKWMVAAVRRVLYPGCKVDNILTLQGRQEMKKSMFFDILCGDPKYFLDGLRDIMSKDSQQVLEGKWIVEFAELEALERAPNNSFKAFVTRTDENYRKSFGIDSKRRPRKCIFGATTNDDDIIRDETGGRRYWIIAVERMLDEAYLRAMRDALWAEAYSLATLPMSGPGSFEHWLSPLEMPQAEDARKQFAPHDAIADKVADYLVGKDRVKLTDVYRYVLCAGDEAASGKFPRVEQKRLSGIMRAIGCQPKQLEVEGRNTNWWLIPAHLQ
jgi:predicted P-loop ATPase